MFYYYTYYFEFDNTYRRKEVYVSIQYYFEIKIPSNKNYI